MGETVRGWAELSMRGVAAARRVVAAHAEAYRGEDPETIGVDEAAGG